jgi:hypothetical protein
MDPLDDSLPASDEQSSHLEPEQPQDRGETDVSVVEQVAITSTCHQSSFSTYQ